MTLGKIIAVTGVSAALVFSSVSPALATEPSNNELEGSSEIVSLPDLPAGVPDLGVSNAELETLASTQDEEDITAVLSEGGPTVTLMDEAGNVIAAAPAEENPLPALKLGVAYPLKNCAVDRSNACIYTKTVSGGIPYRGTGTLTVNVSGAQVLAAGSIKTHFTRSSGTVYNVGVGSQVRLTTAGTIVKIKR